MLFKFKKYIIFKKSKNKLKKLNKIYMFRLVSLVNIRVINKIVHLILSILEKK